MTDFYFDPALYDASFSARDDDIHFYLQLTRGQEAPVLEVGAGTGRVTLPLARAGVSVVAVDSNAAMLASLKQRLEQEPPEVAERVTPIRADATTLTLSARFPLILATFNVVGHFETDELLTQFLGTARTLLAPEGRLIFDTLAPDEEELSADPSEEFELDPIVHPVTGEVFLASERIEYNPETHILLATTQYRNSTTGKEFSVPLRLRQWFPKELERLVTQAGFGSVRLYADYSSHRNLRGADMIVVEARL